MNQEDIGITGTMPAQTPVQFMSPHQRVREISSLLAQGFVRTQTRRPHAVSLDTTPYVSSDRQIDAENDFMYDGRSAQKMAEMKRRAE